MDYTQDMWHTVSNRDETEAFMEQVGYFHDSCIKELKYISGAYVSDRLSMQAINNKRELSLIIQRQYENPSMLELQFEELKYLKLFPVGTEYTCEISGATMLCLDGYIYWADSDELCEDNLSDYDGTLICAKRMKWREIDGCMGKDEFYRAAK